MELLRFPMLRVCVLGNVCCCINLAQARAAQRENNSSAGRAVVAPWLLLPLCCIRQCKNSCNTAARMRHNSCLRRLTLGQHCVMKWPCLSCLFLLLFFLLHSSEIGAFYSRFSRELSELEHTSDPPRERLGQVTHCSLVNPCRLALRRLINQ